MERAVESLRSLMSARVLNYFQNSYETPYYTSEGEVQTALS